MALVYLANQSSGFPADLGNDEDSVRLHLLPHH